MNDRQPYGSKGIKSFLILAAVFFVMAGLGAVKNFSRADQDSIDSSVTTDVITDSPVSDSISTPPINPTGSGAQPSVQSSDATSTPVNDTTTDATTTEDTAPATQNPAPADIADAGTNVAQTVPVVASNPALTTDQADYNPGENAAISGSFFQSLSNVVLRVFGNSEVGNHYTDSSAQLTSDSQGSFLYNYQLDNIFRPLYTVVASDSVSGQEITRTTFTDAAKAAGNLDQCSNGPLASPNSCTGAAWQNGNLNANQAHYEEGDSVPYRITLTNLPLTGSNTLVMEYDIKNGGKDAIDYLTSFDRTEATAVPCFGVSPCVAGTAAAIPVPSSAGSPAVGMPTNSFNALAAAARKFSIFNGTITSITYTAQGNLNAAQSSTDITIQFTASQPTVVFAWGGHIATQADWGAGNSAGGISGSPYHMRFIELNGAGGNQDRSLSASAIAPPAPTGTISGMKFNDLNGNGVKDAGEPGLQNWTINLSGAATSTISTDANGNYSFTGLADGTYTVCEGLQAGWTQTLPVTGATCAGSTHGYNVTISGGNIVTARDFGNTQKATLIVIKHVINNSGGTLSASNFTMNVTGTNVSSASFPGAESPGTTVTLNSGAYSVNETAVSGYTKTLGTSCSGVIAAGQTVTCTITNDDNAASLTLVKNVSNTHGGTTLATAWILSAAGPTAISGTTGAAAVTNAAVNAGTYNLSESVGPAGYSAGPWSCTGVNPTGSQIVLGLGQSATCSITNSDVAPSLTLVKTVINDNNGTKIVSDFILKIDGNSVTSGAVNTVSAGTHTASEVNLPGYAPSVWGGDCAANGSINLALGDHKICTITNNDIAPKLTVIKVVHNGNTGSQNQAANFTLKVNGNAEPQNQAVEFSAGSYVITEVGPDLPNGYIASFSGDCDQNGNVTLGLADNKTCTVTNTAIAPKLTIVKIVDNGNTGATFTASDFQMMIDNGNVPQNQAQTEAIGQHAVSESGPSGYTSAYSADCLNGQIGLALGDNKTCTITNTAIAPTLTLVKHVTNDNGGTKVVSDFILKIDGNSVTSGAVNLSTVGNHTASEVNLPGYTASDWSGDCAAGGTVTLALGDNKTCVITNDDQPGQLIVVKHVINDNGGTLTAADFTMNVTGINVSNAAFPGAELPGTTVTLNAGSYSVDEITVAGYAKTVGADCSGSIANGETKTCTITNDDIAPKLTVVKVVDNGNTGATFAAGDFQMIVDGSNVPQNQAQNQTVGSHLVTESGPAGYMATYSADCPNGSVNLGLADDKTCTITNTAIAPTLTLIKHVTNDNGGTKVVSDFILKVDGNSVTSGVSNATTIGSHTASEVNLPGYTASDWSGDCAANGTISLALADNKTCSITNDDQPAHLTVIKHVINDNGGTKLAADFSLSVSAANALPATFAGDENGVSVTLDAGAYSVDETLAVGYTKTLGADCSGTIANGETKTCTITNDDQPGTLIVKKIVIDDNGGTKVASDFSFSVNNGQVQNFNANGENDLTVNAGTYNVTEPAVAAYATSYNNCSNIQLSNGGTSTCTVTNNDIQPKLTVTKIVINNNGGTRIPASFPLFVNSTSVLTGVQNGFNTGSYVISETADSGYAATISGDCDQNGNVALALGDVKSCVITNDDLPATLIVKKHVINDNGGSQVAGSFTLNVTGSNVSTASFAGSESGVTVTLNAGAYSVDELAATGYLKTIGVNCSGTIANGQTKTCTITNDDVSATRTQGFWQNHTTFTSSILQTKLGGTVNVGTGGHVITITNVQSAGQSRLFGAYFASIPNTSTGAKRNATDKARMQLLQQLVTAKLNCAAFGCSPATIALIASADAAYAGSNANNILTLAGQLDTYNNSQDSLSIPASLGTVGSATPGTSQSWANLAFWNNP